MASLSWVYIDVGGGIFSPYHAQKMPDKYQLLAAVKSSEGGVIELPFYSPSDSPELSYEYLYNWSQHKHNMVNAPLLSLVKVNPGLAKQFYEFSLDANRMDESMVLKLGSSGVRYIVTNCGKIDFQYLNDSPNLVRLSQKGCSVLYEIKSYAKEGRFIDLVKTYDNSFPDPDIKLTGSDCQKSMIVIKQSIGGDYKAGSTIKVEAIINNGGSKKWGGGGADVKLGAVWFPLGKTGPDHTPNLGEQWFNLPKNISPGGREKVTLYLGLPANPGKYEVWFSPLQPGNLWCFHVGVPALRIPIVVGGK